MGPSFKSLAAALLRPLLQGCARLGRPLSRLWSFALTSSRLERAPDPTNVFLGPPEVHGSARIRLGRDGYFYPAQYWETRGAGRIRIGDGAVLSRGVHLVSRQEIHIGAGSMIGEYTSIRDADHDFGGNTPLRHAGHRAAAIHIGRQVWIGRGVTVLPGVTIGDHAVVGANAVVNRDIPPYSVAVGVPARPIRRRAIELQPVPARNNIPCLL